MTIPVVQFCFAVASGDTDRVNRLLSLPEVSDHLFQDLNSGISGSSPALFCLWARQQPPERILLMLQKICPNSMDEHVSLRRKGSIQEASELAISAIKNRLTTFLNEMVDLIDTASQPNGQLTHAVCTAALRFILADDDLPEDKRILAKSMLERFSKIRASIIANDGVRPAVLDGLLKEQKNYLPGSLVSFKTSSKELERRLDHHSDWLRKVIRFKSAPTA